MRYWTFGYWSAGVALASRPPREAGSTVFELRKEYYVYCIN